MSGIKRYSMHVESISMALDEHGDFVPYQEYERLNKAYFATLNQLKRTRKDLTDLQEELADAFYRYDEAPIFEEDDMDDWYPKFKRITDSNYPIIHKAIWDGDK